MLLVGEGISVPKVTGGLFDAATGERNLLTPKGGDKALTAEAEFTPDGKAIYVTTDAGRSFRESFASTWRTGSTRCTPPINWDVEASTFRRTARPSRS